MDRLTDFKLGENHHSADRNMIDSQLCQTSWSYTDTVCNSEVTQKIYFWK